MENSLLALRESPSCRSCSVSTSRPSNRACGFAAPGSPARFGSAAHGHVCALRRRAWLLPRSPSRWVEVIGNVAPLPTLDRFHNPLEVRPLPCTGVTRLRRYYGPVRHPTRPGPSLAGCRLAAPSQHRWGFPCCVKVLCQRACVDYPGSPDGAGVQQSVGKLLRRPVWAVQKARRSPFALRVRGCDLHFRGP